MKRFMASTLIIGVSTFGLVGCEQKTEDKTVRTSETPGGGKVKETESVKIEKSGDAKDPAPVTTPAPETPK
jgi:hypothetical protein